MDANELRAQAPLKGDYVASIGVKGTDGKIHAVEVRIFPEAVRGTGEGQFAWDLMPDSIMTNAKVGKVDQAPQGPVLHVAFKGTESEYTVGPDVPVPANGPGEPPEARCRGVRHRAEA
jgi:hypothetical protein